MENDLTPHGFAAAFEQLNKRKTCRRTSRWRRTAGPFFRSTLGGSSSVPRALHLFVGGGRSPYTLDAEQIHDMITNESKKLAALAILLRVYGVLTLVIFGSLLVGFAIQTPLLADEPKGALNWVIWNGIRCGSEPCYVPPMLFIIHIVWGVFFFMAARSPSAYVSFLSFTMWAYLAHGLLMAGQALTHMSTQWHRFLMDIPYELILAPGIYLWRPDEHESA
jgi:hypothetical protein